MANSPQRLHTDQWTRVLALLTVSTLIPVAVGSVARIAPFVQPTHAFAPGRPWAYGVIFAVASSAWALGSARLSLARQIAVVSVVLIAIGLIAHVAALPLPLDALAASRMANVDAMRPGYGISPSMGLLYGALSVSVWLSASPRLSDRRAITIATLSAIVCTLASVLWIAQLARVLDTATAREWFQAPVQALGGALLLGLAIARRTATVDRLALAPPTWSPALVGTAVGAVVIVLWAALEARETTQLRARARIASDAVQRSIDRQFQSIDAAIRRLTLFTASAPPAQEQFGATVTRLVKETPGLQRLMLLSPSGDARREVPRDGYTVRSVDLRIAATALIAPLLPVTARDSAFAAQSTTVMALSDTRWGIAILQPVNSRLDGPSVVVALIDERELVSEFVADTSAGFVLRAFVADSQVAGVPRTDVPPVMTSMLQFGTRVISLTLTPQASALPSSLPDLVLVLGLAVAALLSLTLWLARKTYEQASVVGMTRMQRAIERATDGVWELDVLEGRAHRSDALLRHLGFDPAQVNGEAAAWQSLIHPDDVELVAEALDAHVSGRAEAFECEYRVRAQNGEWHTIVERGRVVERTLDGRPRRVLGISADTSERARADAAREESERRFRAMFDTAYQLQLLLDLDGSILEANRAAAELAGETPDALQGKIFSALAWWPADELTRTRVQERVARARAATSSRFEVALRGANDRLAIVDFSLKPILDQDGHVVQVLAEGRDLTERKRAEESLREIGALTTMGQLAARVAHEINNPLAGIQNAFLLVRGAISPEHPHFRFVGAIEREIARIAAVTRQLYETYRPDQAMASSSSVILAISDAVIFLEQVNRARQLRIVTDVAGAPSLVPIPDALLRQALYNLVQNALDATPAGGTITVSAQQEGEWCVIRVSDEGPGVPVALQQRIFEPFFSTKDRSVKTGGMGIGLSLVRQSVLAVGGQISVHNRETAGTTFEVRFPMTPIDTGVLR